MNGDDASVEASCNVAKLVAMKQKLQREMMDNDCC